MRASRLADSNYHSESIENKAGPKAWGYGRDRMGDLYGARWK